MSSYHSTTLGAVAAFTLGALTPLHANLIWHSQMDGNANSVVGANGIPTGAPAATTDLNGNPDSAVLFDGASYFDIGNLGSFSAGSISAWVRSDNNGGERGAVAAGATGGGATVYFSFMNQAAGEIRVDLDDGGLRRDAQGGGALTLGQWYHLATTFTADGTLRLYLDGVEVNAQGLAGDNDPYLMTNNGLIGSERTDSRYWIGAIDDVRIYDSELTPAEVTTLFNDGPSPDTGEDSDGDGLNDLWEDEYFGDGSGTVEPSDLTPQDGTGDPDGDGATNEQEETAGSDPTASDSDGDGLSDGDELNVHNSNPTLTDTDGDTLSDADEVNIHGTLPNNTDTDGDGLSDDFEVAGPTDPLNPDSDDDGVIDGIDGSPTDPNNDDDGDGLSNIDEKNVHFSDPLLFDTDDDGIDDGEEVVAGNDDFVTDPNSSDTDFDGWEDAFEVANVASGFDPTVDDSSEDPDGDGLVNGDEFLWSSDPLDPDSDDDGLNDGDEIANFTDPLIPDSDADGLNDGDEIAAGTDPLNFDSDGDGFEDGFEVANAAFGFDPLLDDSGGDADGDTLTNGDELFVTFTDPLKADTDNDGLNDNVEDLTGSYVGPDSTGTDPLIPDTDGDCLLDGVEDNGGVFVDAGMTGTDPNFPDGQADGDSDGFAFATEVLYGTDPADNADTPAGLMPDILFVGGQAAATQGSDAQIENFLSCRYGAEAITYLQATVSTAFDADGRDLLVISSTPGSGAMRNKFPNVAVPTINWEEAIMDAGVGEYGMSSAVITKSTSTTRMALLSHPITAGLPATIDLFLPGPANTETLSTTDLFPGLTAIGTAVDGTGTAGAGNGQPVAGNPMIFLAETGDALDPRAGVTGNVAPAPRVQFPITDNTFANLGPDARELFGRCTDWAMGLLPDPSAGLTLTTFTRTGPNTFEIAWDGGDGSNTIQASVNGDPNQDGSGWIDVASDVASPQTIAADPITTPFQIFRVVEP